MWGKIWKIESSLSLLFLMGSCAFFQAQPKFIKFFAAVNPSGDKKNDFGFSSFFVGKLGKSEENFELTFRRLLVVCRNK